MWENFNKLCENWTKITLNLNIKSWIDNLNNLYVNMKEEDKNYFKDEIINILSRGYNIFDKNHYDSLNSLFETLKLPLMCDFDDINNMIDGPNFLNLGYKFTLKLDNNTINIYPATALTFIDPRQAWYIRNWKYYENMILTKSEDVSDNISPYYNYNINNCVTDNQELLNSQNEELMQINEELRETQQNLLEQVEQNRLEIQDLRNQLDQHNCEDEWLIWYNIVDIEESNQINQNINDSEREVENNTDKSYTVKSWDTLWQIVKQQYGLSSNRDIANCVNKLVKYNIAQNNAWKLAEDNTPDGIFWDKIYVGQKIMLADELTFRKQVFKLENKET